MTRSLIIEWGSLIIGCGQVTTSLSSASSMAPEPAASLRFTRDAGSASTACTFHTGEPRMVAVSTWSPSIALHFVSSRVHGLSKPGPTSSSVTVPRGVEVVIAFCGTVMSIPAVGILKPLATSCTLSESLAFRKTTVSQTRVCAAEPPPIGTGFLDTMIAGITPPAMAIASLILVRGISAEVRILIIVVLPPSHASISSCRVAPSSTSTATFAAAPAECFANASITRRTSSRNSGLGGCDPNRSLTEAGSGAAFAPLMMLTCA